MLRKALDNTTQNGIYSCERSYQAGGCRWRPAARRCKCFWNVRARDAVLFLRALDLNTINFQKHKQEIHTYGTMRSRLRYVHSLPCLLTGSQHAQRTNLLSYSDPLPWHARELVSAYSSGVIHTSHRPGCPYVAATCQAAARRKALRQAGLCDYSAHGCPLLAAEAPPQPGSLVPILSCCRYATDGAVAAQARRAAAGLGRLLRRGRIAHGMQSTILT
jgi:hypothetical protein